MEDFFKKTKYNMFFNKLLKNSCKNVARRQNPNKAIKIDTGIWY